MTRFVDSHGRHFNDLDALKCHITLRELAAAQGATSYSLESSDGRPMLGFSDGTESVHFTHMKWVSTNQESQQGHNHGH